MILDPSEQAISEGSIGPILQALVSKFLLQFRLYLGQSITAAEDGDLEISVVSSEQTPSDKWYGVATYETDVISGVIETKIDTIASAGGMWGSSLLSHIADKTIQAAATNRASSGYLILESISDAKTIDFYTRQGFVDLQTGGPPTTKGGFLVLRVV
jgi:hypothetical protein